MALFRNVHHEMLGVPVPGRAQLTPVEPDDTFEVPDDECSCGWTAHEDGTPDGHDIALHFELNDNYKRLDGPVPPASASTEGPAEQ
jgi:hypothetical protein